MESESRCIIADMHSSGGPVQEYGTIKLGFP